MSLRPAGGLRIASLLPSATEIVSSLSLSSSLCGVTHECDLLPTPPPPTLTSTTMQNPHTMTQLQIHEEVWNSVKNGYSLYALDASQVSKASPNVILTQALCEVCALPSSSLSPSLISTVPKVISLEPTTLDDVMKTIEAVAEACEEYDDEVVERARKVVEGLKGDLDVIKKTVEKLGGGRRPKVAFLEWNDPVFTGGHWVPEMMEIAGGDYTMCEKGDRSIEWSKERVIEYDPDVIVSGPCGFDVDRAEADTKNFIRKNSWFAELRAVRNGRLYVADGNSFFARPGPRLVQGTGILAACLYGEKVAEGLGERLCPSKGFRRLVI
ncbi:hypothetical protein TrST_g7350 [Triparma strigata]|uniref:Fe/B12 periplasmic-binding domain-containing protein n=1 Tax=Triparma strigata TaxID=1606541 RepID=A0A9W7BJ20_9STRA|nr:hypothetical protein TrST_g7350 [Triparma strigata]